MSIWWRRLGRLLRFPKLCYTGQGPGRAPPLFVPFPPESHLWLRAHGARASSHLGVCRRAKQSARYPWPRQDSRPRSEARSQDASQRPDSAWPGPRPPARPRPAASAREGGKGRARLAQAAAPPARPAAGRPSRPAPTSGAHGPPELPAARPQRRPSRPGRRPPEGPRGRSPACGTRLPRGASGGRAFERAANPEHGCLALGELRSGLRRPPIDGSQRSRPRRAAQWRVARAGPVAEAAAALTVAARAGLAARKAEAARGAGNGGRRGGGAGGGGGGPRGTLGTGARRMPGAKESRERGARGQGNARHTGNQGEQKAPLWGRRCGRCGRDAAHAGIIHFPLKNIKCNH